MTHFFSFIYWLLNVSTFHLFEVWCFSWGIVRLEMLFNFLFFKSEKAWHHPLPYTPLCLSAQRQLDHPPNPHSSTCFPISACGEFSEAQWLPVLLLLHLMKTQTHQNMQKAEFKQGRPLGSYESCFLNQYFYSCINYHACICLHHMGAYDRFISIMALILLGWGLHGPKGFQNTPQIEVSLYQTPGRPETASSVVWREAQKLCCLIKMAWMSLHICIHQQNISKSSENKSSINQKPEIVRDLILDF